MSHPALVHTRISPLRRLTDTECSLLEFEAPLLLARRERRFLFGPWRPARGLLVATHPAPDGAQRVVMVTDASQLRARGVEP